MTEEAKWNAFCTYLMDDEATLSFVEGSTVEIHYQGEMSQERVARAGYDPTGVYGWFTVSCFHVSNNSGFGGEWHYVISDPVPLEVLRVRARARIDLEDPPVDTNPSFTERFTIVRIPTWLWVDDAYWFEVHDEEETAGFVTVGVTAEPVNLSWEFDGGQWVVDCGDDPGRPWTFGDEDPDCFVEFNRSSAGQPNDAFAGSGSVAWEFRWSLNGADQGPFDELFYATTDFEIQVGEIHAVVTSGRVPTESP